MQRINFPEISNSEKILARPSLNLNDLKKTIDEVFKEVAIYKDEAILKYTSKFDKVELTTSMVTEQEIQEAVNSIDPIDKQSIQVAFENIYAFHFSQKRDSEKVMTSPGVECWSESRAIESVGLYVPGGSAPLFSTVLMLAIPANIAGCTQIVLSTPPQKNGKIHPLVLFCANLCGVHKIYKIGGAQAIAALSLGTPEVEKVDKIFGPGNQYVTAAKQKAQELGVAIDFPAGPSELLVYTDESSNPAFVASDLLSQAEHGPDSQVILLGTSEDILDQVREEIAIQLLSLSRRSIAKQALSNSKSILVADTKDALKWINAYAPEHLILAIDEADKMVPFIQNAGSVFLGHYTPESAGDYASGTNHTLPTNGNAKMYSGVNLDAYVKQITFQEISQAGLKNMGRVIMRMAQQEGLDAHKNAVKIRMI